jgi:Tfp pilus assembly protein PilF
MSSRPRLLWLSLPVLAACAAAPAGDAEVVAAEASAARPSGAAASPEPALPQQPGAAVAADANAFEAATAPAAPAPPVFSFWTSPDFQRRFADSLIAESDYEPRSLASEQELLLEIAELLGKATPQGMAAAQDEAIGRLQARIDAGSSASLHFVLGTLLFQRERLADAAAAYEKAVERHGPFRRAWKNLALVQMRLGDHAAATGALTRTVQLGGADALTYALLGFALGAADDHVGAETAYRMAALLDPDTIDHRLGLARSLFKQRRHADAAALCEVLVAKAPERAELWLLQANAFVGTNEPRKAVQNLELVERLGGATTDSLLLLGDIYVNEELPELAASAYARAIAKDQKGEHAARLVRAAKALAARGAHAQTKQLADAVSAAYGAKLDDAAKKDLLKLRARIALATGAGDDEARVLEQVLELDPLDGEALILLGRHHARRGEPDLAILQYERAAGIAAFEADAKVAHAHLLVGQARYAEALPLLRKAQAVRPREHVQTLLDQVERIAQGR